MYPLSFSSCPPDALWLFLLCKLPPPAPTVTSFLTFPAHLLTCFHSPSSALQSPHSPHLGFPSQLPLLMTSQTSSHSLMPGQTFSRLPPPKPCPTSPVSANTQNLKVWAQPPGCLPTCLPYQLYKVKICQCDFSLLRYPMWPKIN